MSTKAKKILLTPKSILIEEGGQKDFLNMVKAGIYIPSRVEACKALSRIATLQKMKHVYTDFGIIVEKGAAVTTEFW